MWLLQLDRDNSGYLTRDELVEALKVGSSRGATQTFGLAAMPRRLTCRAVLEII